MSAISIVVSAFNEEKVLGRCLESVKWADEIIVVNNSSDDRTEDIARKYGARIFNRPNHLMLNINKNYGFTQAKNGWILNLDADEEVSPDLKTEIINVISGKEPYDGYWIARKNIIFGKWIRHGIWWPDKQLRLFRRGKGNFPCKRIHEYIAVDGSIGEMKNPYLHYNYESVSQYLATIQRATTSESLEMEESGYRIDWQDAVKFPVSDFVKIYFAQAGYKDGLHGLVLSFLQAFYSFIVFVRLWEKTGFADRNITLDQISRELKLNGKDIRYWEKTDRISASQNPVERIVLRIRRKLDL